MSSIKKSLLTFLIVVLTIATFLIFNEPVKANVEDDYCFLCNQDSNSEYYKEVQFINKIKAIKSVFGDKIDEIVLAATVLHRYTADQVISDQYDEDYDETTYTASWNSFSSNVNSLGDETGSIDAANEQIDLLTAATIVMLSSNGFGTYDEDKYKEALAGSQLVGDDSIFGHAFNAAFCTVGGVVDFVTTPITSIYGVFSGDTVESTLKRVTTRYTNMYNICTNGYIGGVYDEVSSIENEEQKQAAKEVTAQSIIDLANYYKQLRGEVDDNCVYQSVGSGDATNWRQCDSRWGSNTMGSSGVSICRAGCTSTSMAYLIYKSGTALKVSSFDPGVFVANASYTTGGSLYWGTWTGAAPNFKMDKQNVDISKYTASTVASVIEKELNTSINGKYQTFVVLEITGHWIAVDHVENGVVYVMDPAADAGVGLVTLETALNRGGKTRYLLHYNTFYATDVLAGSTGPSSVSLSSSSTNYCNGGTFEEFKEFLGYVEGVWYCNYNGQGEKTGYGTENLGDGAGMTTSYGVTQNNDKQYADKVGYTSFISDITSGCVDKSYIDQMVPLIVQDNFDAVSSDLAGVTLTNAQVYALMSIRYNTGAAGSYKDVVSKIKQYGTDSYEIIDCMKKLGCGWGNSSFNDGLVRRRIAEYELFKTSNFNADKPTETYSYFSSINTESKWTEYEKSHWPTSRS